MPNYPSIEGLASETYVLNKIAEASLSGGEVDLSNYITQEELNEYTGGKKQKYVTQAEYEALSDDEKSDKSIVWNITDLDEVIPTKLSEFENDCNYATEQYVLEQIDNIPINTYSLSLVGNKLSLVKNGTVVSSVILPETSSTPDDEMIPVESITLNENSLVLDLGDTFQLETEISPANATNQVVTWSSSNNDIATVDNGLITTIGVGECIITALCDNKSVSCNVTIAKEEIEEPEEPELPNNTKLRGDLYSLESETEFVASKKDYIDTGVKLFEEDKDFTIVLDFTPSEANVIANNTHYVLSCSQMSSPFKGISITGTSNRYMTSLNYKTHSNVMSNIANNKKQRSVIFIIRDSINSITKINWYSIDEDGTKTLITSNSYNGIYDLGATGTGASLDNFTVILGATKYEWNNTYGSHWNGIIHSCDIFSKQLNDEEINQYFNGVSDDEVTEDDEITGDDEEIIECTSLSLDESAITLKVDSNCDRMVLIPKVAPKNSTDEIIWSSDNSNIAKVDNNGIVTSIAGTGGTTTIRAVCGNQTATCRVTVQTSAGTGTGGTGTGGTGTGGASAYVTAFDVLQDEYIFNTLNATDSQTITPFIRPATSTKTKTYKSTDTDVATVDKNGTIIPKGEGECLVYACCGAFVVSSKVIVHVPKETYSSPNITVENFKAKVEQDGHVEYFDLSYEPNTGHPYYKGYKELTDSEGTRYYLSLLNKGTSKFRIDGLIPANGGWMSLEHHDGANYILTFNNSIYAQYNNWSLDTDIQIKNNSIDRGFVQHALNNINASLDGLNIKLVDTSKNSFELANYDESWIGLYDFHTPSGTREAYFDVLLNKDVINSSYGTLDVNNKNSDTYKYWLSTSVHEFGHFMGIRDNSMHLPTMYSYSRNLLKCNYLQPNDIYVIKHFWKDLFNKEVKNERVLAFDYPKYSQEQLIDNSDVIVSANLKLARVEDISVGADLVIPYNVYEIIPNEIEKGNLINNELKIYINEKLVIDEDKKYKLYLKQYDSIPCSLVNISQGIKEA